ncbi:glycoside hydrolase family 43 protein [Aplosporella prunicola CBS 121167]|uniref:Glycoside hydrolase family 43 protein n=1 Tax=Aplosporella prunicola CBS 121167 TaxID=1176127 RepID=A0A6A6BT30_9PEZI|nr:glycoside hydrolase family 43 protein [Aplosporella prunicola CBS 121167]KAF2145987.1 glycoside hydrolase family 43 protein [Aplosporella prunicola CBS 121167]
MYFSLHALAVPIVKRSVNGPVISSDFPDPSIRRVGDTWYAFGTTVNNGAIHVQIAKSSDFQSWTVTGKDALPNLPSWVYKDKPLVWAPDVIQNDAGKWVLYFSASKDAKYHCIGTATSDVIEGPYTPQDAAWACPLDQGGAIDASSFVDSDGSRYVTYKIDGNAKGNGGVCNNGVAPIQSTPIMQQKVAGNGIDKIGGAYQLLDRSDGDGPLIEAPSIGKLADGRYVLFFSSNCYSTINYDVTYALADSVSGPYTKHGPLLVSQGKYGLWSPGGASVTADATKIVFHAYLNAGSSIRGMYTADITFDGTTGIA